MTAEATARTTVLGDLLDKTALATAIEQGFVRRQELGLTCLQVAEGNF